MEILQNQKFRKLKEEPVEIEDRTLIERTYKTHGEKLEDPGDRG